MSDRVIQIGNELMTLGDLLRHPLGDKVRAGFALDEAAKACEAAARTLRNERVLVLYGFDGAARGEPK